MINIPIDIQLPELWGTQNFAKSDWGNINLIVGPNGTGKSLFAEQLKQQLKTQGFQPRLLNAERLSGLEKGNYSSFTGFLSSSHSLERGFDISRFNHFKSKGENLGLSSDAFVILRERLDLRIKVEALLSDIFQKTMRFSEEGGYLKVKIQNINGTGEYQLKEQECHGLKELLTLLTFLYDKDKNCFIFDEPELHLHPQFQSFFLSEIRKLAGDPKNDSTKKLFFIITHSPYFLDLRDLEDLKSVLVFHYNSPPTFVNDLDPEDQYILKRFLPRFNTHHKQFFFSPNPVFVEGYTDQQIISLLFDKLDFNISASGSCIIDVGGKDELAVFYRLCKKLKLSSRIIADLDAFFKGKLRQVAQNDERCNNYIQENGLGTNISSLIGELDTKLKEVADDLIQKTSSDTDVSALINFLQPIINNSDRKVDIITSVLIALQKFKDEIVALCPIQATNINYILPRFHHLLKAFETANIFIMPKGEIENYYTQSTIDYFNVTNKDTLFHIERDYILSCNNKAELEEKYFDLLVILKKSVPVVEVDLIKHLKFQVIEWIQSVQRAISKGDVTNIENLKTNAKVDYILFNQLFEILDLEIQEDKKFKCKIRINNTLSSENIEVDFNEETIPHQFELGTESI